MANLRVADIAAAKTFYTDFLGLSTEVFMGGPLHLPRDRGEGPARDTRCHRVRGLDRVRVHR